MILVLAPEYGPDGRGAPESVFRVEATRFAVLHKTPVPVWFDNTRPSKSERLRRVRSEIENIRPEPLDALAIFCRGSRARLEIGLDLSNAILLADAIERVAPNRHIPIALYCSPFDEEDGLAAPGSVAGTSVADELSRQLGAAGVQATVFAPSMPGHVTRNPHIRRFRSDGQACPVVAHGAELWPAWSDALRRADLRLRYPLMSPQALDAELRGRHVEGA